MLTLLLALNGRDRGWDRIYRYYVTRDSIADGYDTCPVTSVRAADVEGAVLDHVQKLLTAPELIARTWAAAKRGWDLLLNGRLRNTTGALFGCDRTALAGPLRPRLLSPRYPPEEEIDPAFEDIVPHRRRS